ncbi:hypothetical protein NM688_g5165 [Phlebia brevispora]|uniref:Uncharacterized protein n=1 Tax=Phlebia brevispora TaxID=194682 RepID=A0ACC1SZK7_9APHY|nr:hypothetical protein NM688_g5165 [Phlebia brevispora]
MSVPRWLNAITTALSVPENKGKVAYQVATIDSQNIPHVRTQIHRGFVTPRDAAHVPLLITSTDVRSPKAEQMLFNTAVEIAWWMEGSMDQFRISGRAFIIPGPDHPQYSTAFSHIEKSAILSTLTSSGETNSDSTSGSNEFDFEQKRREIFDAMRPAMKATWYRPVAPGSVIASYDVPKGWSREVPTLEEAKTEEDKKKWHDALANFAMLLIEPTKIDWVQLGEKPNRRTLFTRTDSGDGWKEEILAP